MSPSGRLARCAAALTLAGAALCAVPAAANAAAPIGGGAPIVVGGNAGCTITAAGYDGGGVPVAFTAAHCSDQLGAPVMIEDQPALGVVGRVATRNEVLDYSVIALDPSRVTPVRQAGVVGTGPIPAAGDVVCKDGFATGHSCGVTWQADETEFWSQMCAGHGDSGAPVMRGDRLVGMVSGGDMPPAAGGSSGSLENVLPSCMTPLQSPFFLPAISISFERIVGDATARHWPGGGFRMP